MVASSLSIKYFFERTHGELIFQVSLEIDIVVYQGLNQTNQDSIEAWLKHEEPNSTRQQQEVINQTLAPARLNTACNSKTKGTLNDNSNAGIW